MSLVRSRRFLTLALLSVFLCFTALLHAQSDTAAIVGTVKDATGAVVPNATITIRNEGTGIERKVATDNVGRYVASSLPPGLYTIVVEAAGFKRFETKNNKLDASINANVDVDMQVGSASESVSVTAEAPAVQSESATLGRVVTSNEVRNIPLNGRNPILLALLKPGVNGGALAGFTFGLSTGGLNINGSRTQDNLITYDGAVAVRTRSNGTGIGVADVDAVQEVQILTANYNAEYGRSAGGQVRIVTKSGGRDFHGDLYEYFRNSAMNANSWTRNATVGRPDISGRAAPFRFNQPGYDFNGPIFVPGKFNSDRNKLFFLFSQQWTKYRQEDLSTIVVPTAAMRRGDFSELLSSNPYFSSPQYIRDPLLSGNCNAADRTACFPGNIIPASRLSPNGVALLNSYPAQSAGFLLGRNNYVQSRLATDDQRTETGAVDYLPAQNHYIRFRLQNFNLKHNDSFRSGTDLAPSTLDRPNQTASLNYIWTVSPTVVNEFLLTASADHVRIFVQTDGDRYKRSRYGINYPYLYQQKEIFDKIPTTEISNFATIDGGPYPSSSAGPIYDISNNTTVIKGRHTIKFGVLFERAGQNDFDQINVNGVPGGTNNQNGRFVFSDSRPGGSGLAIANAALGLYSTYAELGTRSYTPYRGHMVEWFAQDSWKVSDKLHLDLGIRHTIVQPFYSSWRNMSVFDVASYDPTKAAVVSTSGLVLSGDPYNGVIIPGSGFTDEAKGRFPASTDPSVQRLFKGPKEYSQIHYKDFQPRIGLAYSINSKTVFRTGVGRFFTRLGVSDSVFLGGNPPFQPTTSLSNGSVDNPGGQGGAVNFPLPMMSQDPIFNNPEAWAWNATVEREFNGIGTLEVAYVGRRGLHGQRERNINQLAPGTIQANPGVNEAYLRPYKGFSFIRVTGNDATSRYNGLQIGLNRRFAKGLSYGVSYTYSKLYDDGSAQRDVIPNAFDASQLWGPADYDRRHVAVINAVYELPFLRTQNNITSKLLGGWQISLVTQFQTGTPFTVRKGVDYAGVGTGSGDQIWNLVGDPHLSDPKFSPAGSRDSNLYFNPAAFQAPATGTFTTQRNRNLLYNPGFQNWTGALFKRFAITERQYFTFRAEIYNIPNHPNWSGADTDPTSGTFGKVTQKNFERNMQLSLRYTF